MRADRLIALIMHLQLAGKTTAQELARLLEVSERTIYRDIDVLSGMGVPVQADAGLGGGFSLPPNYRAKVDGLNAPEIHALFLQLSSVPFQQLGIDRSMRSALLKLLGNLSNRHREEADWIRDRVYLDMESWRGRDDSEERLRLAKQAVWEQRGAEIVYTDRGGSTKLHAIACYGIVLKAGTWFIVGETESGIHAFRLAKVQSIALSDDVFERPADFRLETFWEGWKAEFEQRQYPCRVVAELTEEAAARVSRLGGVQSGKETLANGRGAPVFGFESEEAAMSAFLALGGSARVESPATLRARIAEEALKLAAAYGERGTIAGAGTVDRTGAREYDSLYDR